MDIDPYTFELAAGRSAGQQVAGAHQDMQRVLRSLKIDRVRILDGEPTYKTSIQGLRRRVGLETLLALAAADVNVECAVISRPTVRAVVGIGRAGKLSSHVSSFTDIVGPKWKDKRDLAALAALAGGLQA